MSNLNYSLLVREIFMWKGPPLFLYEEVMLLALQDKEGTIASNTMYQFAIGAAILSDLLLSNHICIDGSKNKLVSVVSDKQFEDPIINECLEKISTSKKKKPLKEWVTKFSNLKDLKNRAARQLCKRNILKEDEDKVLIFFTRKIFPEINPIPEKQLIKRLRKAIFTATREIDMSTIVLISLAHNTNLLKVVFDKKKLKERKDRIEKIINGDMAGAAAKEAIEAMQAAIFVTVIMPAVIVTS